MSGLSTKSSNLLDIVTKETTDNVIGLYCTPTVRCTINLLIERMYYHFIFTTKIYKNLIKN